MILPTAAADELARLAALTERLRRINAELDAWSEYDANRHLPPDLRRFVPRPDLPRDVLADLHAMVLGEIDAWEQRWLRRT